MDNIDAKLNLQEIEDALLDAFPQKTGLQRMILHQLNEKLAAISEKDDLTSIIFDLVQWAKSNGKLNRLIEGARKENPGNEKLLNLPSLYSISKADPSIIFVNRTEELNKLNPKNLKMLALSPYTLIKAPAGYGKTCLLRQLINNAQSDKEIYENWTLRYIDFQQEGSREHFLRCLAKDDKFSSSDCEEVCNYIVKYLASPTSNSRRSVLLVLDSLDRVEDSTRLWLYELFTNLQKKITAYRAFYIGFIFAGRNLDTFWENFVDYNPKSNNPRPRPPEPIDLKSFQIFPIKQLVAERSKIKQIPLTPDQIKEISIHLEYLSGGHPKVLQKLVDDLEKRDFVIGPIPEYFIENHQRLIKECVAPIATEMLEGLKNELKQVIQIVSVFRVISGPMLNELIKRGVLLEATNTINLLSELQKNRLISGPETRDAPFYRDNLNRRVLSLCMEAKDPDNYQKYNQIAAELYKTIYNSRKAFSDSCAQDHLKRISPIEWLYHSLKRQDLSVDDLKNEFNSMLWTIVKADPILSDSTIKKEIREDTELYYLVQNKPDFAELVN